MNPTSIPPTAGRTLTRSGAGEASCAAAIGRSMKNSVSPYWSINCIVQYKIAKIDFSSFAIFTCQIPAALNRKQRIANTSTYARLMLGLFMWRALVPHERQAM